MAVFALLVNFIALIVVGYQTYITRRALLITESSLKATRESVDLATRTTQISMLPHANWIIQAEVALRSWLGDLQQARDRAIGALNASDAEQLRALSDRGRRTPSGLVRRFAIRHAPNWLSTIWFAGAQYYFDAKAAQCLLWNRATDRPEFDLVLGFAQRCDQSCHGIEELLRMTHDIVPAAYSFSPARLSDEEFLD